MKPAEFSYVAVRSVAEVLASLEESDDARILAGGQNLVPMLNMRLVQPSLVIDINGCTELDHVTLGADGSVTLGALTRYSTVEASEVVAARFPLLCQAVRHVGDRQVRNRGTVGGSLAQADPSGEVPTACVALDAEVIALSTAGERVIPVRELFLGPYHTCLEPDELITAIRFPDRGHTVDAMVELTRRHNDYGIVVVAASARVLDDGRVDDVRVALGAVAQTPVLAEDVGRILSGTELDDATIDDAVRLVDAVIDPASDPRASADYRRHVTPIYVARALRSLREQKERSR